MPEHTQESKPKRKPISKKVRFEVFKRDQFTCQYCGRKAPDVILQVDHIKPIAKGGTNSIMNLITSCSECNLGKGAREINDDTVLSKQIEQAQYLEERRQQLKMLQKWVTELEIQKNMEIDTVNKVIESITSGRTLTEHGKHVIVYPMLKKFGLEIVIQAVRDGMGTYGNIEKTLQKLHGICSCINDPILAQKIRILCKMRKRYYNFDWQEASAIIQDGYDTWGASFYDVIEKSIYTQSGSWRSVRQYFQDWANGVYYES